MKDKSLTFQHLQPFSFKHEPKMSRGALDYMLQMLTVQLKTLLNEVCKVIDKACAFLLSDWRPSLWGIRCPMIFQRAMLFQVLENLTPVWKCIEIKLPSYLNNFERLTLVICLYTKDLLHRSLYLVEYLKMLTISQQ